MSVAPSLDSVVESLAGDLRSIKAPRGATLNARSWSAEAPLRMLLNNLDAEVAERPEDLVVYGGSGKAARSHEALKAIVGDALAQGTREDWLKAMHRASVPGSALRSVYDGALNEDIPAEMLDLLGKLG